MDLESLPTHWCVAVRGTGDVQDSDWSTQNLVLALVFIPDGVEEDSWERSLFKNSRIAKDNFPFDAQPSPLSGLTVNCRATSVPTRTFTAQ